MKASLSVTARTYYGRSLPSVANSLSVNAGSLTSELLVLDSLVPCYDSSRHLCRFLTSTTHHDYHRLLQSLRVRVLSQWHLSWTSWSRITFHDACVSLPSWSSATTTSHSTSLPHHCRFLPRQQLPAVLWSVTLQPSTVYSSITAAGAWGRPYPCRCHRRPTPKTSSATRLSCAISSTCCCYHRRCWRRHHPWLNWRSCYWGVLTSTSSSATRTKMLSFACLDS